MDNLWGWFSVAGLLREEGSSLQANAKTIKGTQHPDRDAQFHYLNKRARHHGDAGDPVISVDSTKELIGDYQSGGQELAPAGQPVKVKTHDFPGQAEKAISYGIYDYSREHRLSQHRHRSRHRGVRRRLDPPLVVGPRPARLPPRPPAADHR